MQKNISKDVSETQKPEVQPEAPKFRYVCEGCTGVAMLSTNNPAGVKITCKACGKEQVTKLANYIIL